MKSHTEYAAQINTAYGILSNATLRADYDSPSSSPSSHGHGHSHFWDDEDDDDDIYFTEGDEEYETYEDFRRQFFTDGPSPFRNFGGGGGGFFFPGGGFTDRGYSRGPTEEEIREMAEERAREMEGARREKAEMRKQYKAQRDKEMTERRATLARKKMEDERKARAKEDRDKNEKKRQLELWKSVKATTAAEKRASCLHTEFWPRQQMKNKFKCMGCSQQRGPAAFKCPYCSTLNCQACLNEFTEKRVKSADS